MLLHPWYQIFHHAKLGSVKQTVEEMARGKWVFFLPSLSPLKWSYLLPSLHMQWFLRLQNASQWFIFKLVVAAKKLKTYIFALIFFFFFFIIIAVCLPSLPLVTTADHGWIWPPAPQVPTCFVLLLQWRRSAQRSLQMAAATEFTDPQIRQKGCSFT